MKKLVFYTMSATLLLWSCNNEESFNVKESIEESEVFNLDITYAGKEYHVPCMLDSNDSLIYLDENFNNLYRNEISKNPNLVTCVSDNDKITYYASEKEMLSVTGCTYVDSVEFVNRESRTRTVNNTDIAGRFELYDDVNYHDRMISHDISYISYFSFPKLRLWEGFNDKTSAMKVFCYIPENDSVYINNIFVETQYDTPKDPSAYLHSTAYSTNDLRLVFMGYHNINYTGASVCCILKANERHLHPNLKKIGWNDEFSSVVLRLAVKNLYPEYPSPHNF